MQHHVEYSMLIKAFQKPTVLTTKLDTNSSCNLYDLIYTHFIVGVCMSHTFFVILKTNIILPIAHQT